MKSNKNLVNRVSLSFMCADPFCLFECLIEWPKILLWQSLIVCVGLTFAFCKVTVSWLKMKVNKNLSNINKKLLKYNKIACFKIAIENRFKVQYNISWNIGHGEERDDTHSNL